MCTFNAIKHTSFSQVSQWEHMCNCVVSSSIRRSKIKNHSNNMPKKKGLWSEHVQKYWLFHRCNLTNFSKFNVFSSSWKVLIVSTRYLVNMANGLIKHLCGLPPASCVGPANQIRACHNEKVHSRFVRIGGSVNGLWEVH